MTTWQRIRSALARAQRPSWVRTPLMWVAASSALGIVLGVQLHFVWWMLLLSAGMMLLTWLCVRFQRWPWVALLACCLVLSACWGSLRATVPVLPPEAKAVLTGRVDGEPRVKAQSTTLYLRGARMTVDGQDYAIPGRLWLRYAPNAPDGVRPPEPGQTVHVEARVALPQGQRNPGGFDFRAYLLRQGAYMTAYAYKPWEISGKPSGGPMAWMRASRKTLSRHMDALFGKNAPLVKGMLIGERQDISEEDQLSFRRSGIMHLLSISGLHVAFVALPLIWLINKLRFRGRTRFALVGGVLAFYCLLVGAPPSMVRACVMMLMLQGANVAGRRYDTFSALAAAFWGMLLVNPLSLWDASLTLSCAAVLGIALFSAKVQKWLGQKLPRMPRWLAGTLAVSLAAQLGTLPLIALYYNEFSLLALLTNVVAVPISGVIVVAGLVATLLDFLWRPLAFPLALVVRLCTVVLKAVSDAVAALPFATLRVASPPWYVVAAGFLSMGLLGGIVSLGKAYRKWVLSAAMLVLAFGASYLLAWHGPQYIQLDVGQGDAAVLRSGGYTAVIDTGSQGTRGLPDYLRHEGLSVDALFVSHPHEDHAGALKDLLDAGIPIRQILLPSDLTGEQMDLPAYDSIVAAAMQHIPLVPLSAGDHRTLAPDISVDVLGPKAHSGAKDVNDLSLVLRFDIGGVRLLTTGDLTEKAEPLTDIDCDILKVAHHGAKASSSEAFLEAVTPALALISVGYNTYGHPTEEALERLRAVHARVLRTDYGGALMLTFGKNKVGIQTFIPYKEREQ